MFGNTLFKLTILILTVLFYDANSESSSDNLESNITILDSGNNSLETNVLDINSTVDGLENNITNLDLNTSPLDENVTVLDLNTTILDSNISKSDIFEKRFVYFDQTIFNDDNFEKLKQVIIDANDLGFNGLVLSEEYIYTRLSHENVAMDIVRERFMEISNLARENGLEIIPMHFNPSIPTVVVKDKNENNPFYQNGRFDFDEANSADNIFEVNGREARIKGYKQSIISEEFFSQGKTFQFEGLKPNREYKITLTLTTNNFQKDYLKVSVLDSFDTSHTEILYGINKYFRGIKSTQIDALHHVYFNTLNHKDFNGKIKIYLSSEGEKDIFFSKIEVEEVALVSSLRVNRAKNIPIVRSIDSNITFKSGVDYMIGEEYLYLLSQTIKDEQYLMVTWYPKVDVARLQNQETMADFCADPTLYIDIIKDQYQRIDNLFGGVDGIAFNNDEWREAGYNKDCKKLFEKEYNLLNKTGDFTGGDYIGITTRRVINEAINFDKKVPVYVMSDMFDPNFNAKNPYMGVNNGAEGSWDYLPKDTVVFNWIPNPKETGLDEMPYQNFLDSFKHFSDHNISQIIAGYHDDIGNVDTNLRVYKDSSPKVQDSIIGFMFLIWNQGGKEATYEDMPLVVKQICEQLPTKWPEDVCIKLK